MAEAGAEISLLLADISSYCILVHAITIKQPVKPHVLLQQQSVVLS